MPDIFGGPSTSTVVRWTTFVVVEANFAFLYVYDRASGLPSITEVSKQYATPFAPANYVNAIYWIIGAALLFFYVAALWPRRRRTHIYDPFVIPLAIASTVGSAWVVAFRHDQLGLAVVLTGFGVVLGATMFARAAASPAPRSRWLRVPFALLFGWITFAALTGTAQWFNARGWLTTLEMSTAISLALLAIAAAMGGIVALRYREFVYPMVIAWAVGGIYAGQRMLDPMIAGTARDVCIGLLIVAGLAAIAVAGERFPRHAVPTASRRAERHERAVAPAALAVRQRASLRWPRFQMPSRTVIEQQHRRYLLDLDAATTIT